jgi:hypothetical protein
MSRLFLGALCLANQACAAEFFTPARNDFFVVNIIGHFTA